MPYLTSLRTGASLIDVFKAFPATSTPPSGSPSGAICRCSK